MTNRRARRESFHDAATRELSNKYTRPLRDFTKRAYTYNSRQEFIASLKERYFLHNTYGAVLNASPRIMRLSDQALYNPQASERAIADAATLAMMIMDNATKTSAMVWDPSLAENCRNACLHPDGNRPPETQVEDHEIQSTLGSICMNGQLMDLGYQPVVDVMTQGDGAYYRDRHAQDSFRNSFGLLMIAGIDAIANRRMIEKQANTFSKQLGHYGTHARELLQ